MGGGGGGRAGRGGANTEGEWRGGQGRRGKEGCQRLLGSGEDEVHGDSEGG